MTAPDQSIETRQRLLTAAGEVFAEHGFHDTTIREICQRARANVAAVHYHFGDKAELYTAVFDYAKNLAKEQLETKLAGATTPEGRLRTYVSFFLTRFFDEGRPAWLGKLMAQEMIQPTKVLDDLVRERIRPNHERLKGIARELIGSEVDDETLRLCAFSVAAQCFFYFHHRPVVARLYPDFTFDPSGIERLVEHITKFSLAALKEYAP